MRKFTSLLVLFCAFVGMGWASPLDLPTYSTAEDPIYYTIRNTRSVTGPYLYYAADGNTLKDRPNTDAASMFYFVEAEEGGCYICNYATDLRLASHNSWSAEGTVFTLSETPHSSKAGLAFGFSGTYLNEENWRDGYTTWSADDAGSIFVVEPVTDFSSVVDVDAAKKVAIAKLEELKKGVEAFEIFSEDMSAIASAIYRIKHLAPYENTIKGLSAVIDRIDDIVGETFDAVYDKTVCFTSYGRKAEGQDLTINQNGANTAIKSGYEGLWKMKGKGDGTFTLYNFASNLYLGPTVGTSARIPAKTSEYEAGAYALRLHDIANQVVNLTNNGNTLHVEGTYGNVVQWNDNNAGASQWKIELPDMAAILEETKEKALNQLNEWNQSPLIYNATLVAEAKATIEAITETDINAIEAINAELEKITEELSSKYFTFRATSTDNHRNQVWIQANGNRAIGAHIENPDFYSIWKIRPAGGASFYLYNEVLNAYLGAPNNNCPLSVTPTTAYTFEIVDAANNVIEMHTGGETLHASNHGDDKLLNWDGDEAASRWKIDIFDVNGALDAVIAECADKHAEVPALGQYPTAAYEELIAAKTEGSAIVAIINFQNSKNLPVFTINGVIDYAKGKSIYVNSDGNLHFKKTDKYDRSMLWVLDQNATTVSPIEKVGIRNFATGEGFWGSQTIKITETNPEVADDDIFLFYTTGNGTPIHAQNDLQEVVRWGSYDAGSGSAWTFTYVGSTFELSQYTETYFQALDELKEMYNNIPDYEFGVGVNYYSEQKHGSLAAAKQQAYEVLAKEKATEEELLAAGKALRIALAQVSLNKPVEGKFYRLRCVDSDKYMQYTIADKKFHMVAGDDGKTHDATFCYYNSGLVSLQNALYMNLSRNEASYSRSLCKVYFTESSVLGQYNIELSERMLYGAGDMIDSGTAVDNRAGYRWQLEEVTEIPVTISEAGYASFYATAAMELPAELEAYYVSYVGEDQVALEQIEGIIPDGAAVLLKGEAGDYNLTVVNEKTTEIKDNKLKGVVVSKYIAGDAYVLAADDAALIKAELNRNGNGEAVENGTHFLANGFSAYLPVADAIQDALTFNFDGSITGVTLVPVTNNANAAIYDLSGRRVVNAVKGGIYIQNGKKFIVK